MTDPQAQQPDVVTQMVQDPDFGKMAISEQRKALAAHDPIFQDAGDDAIGQFVQAHQAVTQPQQPPDKPGALKRFAQQIGFPTSSQELQATTPQVPHNLGDAANLFLNTPWGLAAKVGLGLASNAKQGIQQGSANLHNLRQQVQSGQMTPEQGKREMLSAGAPFLRAAGPFGGAENIYQDAHAQNPAGMLGGVAGIATQALAPELIGRGAAITPQIAQSAKVLARPVVQMGLEAAQDIPVVRGVLKGAKTFKDVPAQLGRTWNPPYSEGTSIPWAPPPDEAAPAPYRASGSQIPDAQTVTPTPPRQTIGPERQLPPFLRKSRADAPAQSTPPAQVQEQPIAQSAPESPTPAPESAPAQSPAQAGLYGKYAGKSRLPANQRQLLSPSASTAPNPGIVTETEPHPPEIMQILDKPGEISDADMTTLQNYFAKQRLSNLLSGAKKQGPAFSLGDMLKGAVAKGAAAQ